MKRWERACAGLVGAVAVLVVVGWYAGSELLTTPLPGTVAMKPNTALALLALALVAGGVLRGRPAVLSAGAVAALAVATLGEQALGVTTRLDMLLPGVDLDGESPEMAVSTAVALGLLGVALAGREVAGRGPGLSRAVRALGLGAFTVGYVAVLGYAYDVSPLYQVGDLTRMALHTATAVVLLSVSVVLSEPDRGVVGLLRDRRSAGRLVRALLPFVLLAPAVLGWLLLRGRDLGWFDTPFGVALLVLSMTSAGTALAWWMAVRVRRLDAERDDVDDELRRLNEGLERTVAERTSQLVAAAERLEALIRVAPVGIVELGADGAVLRTNDQWLSLSGQTQGQAQGDGWARAVHPDDRGRLAAGWSAAVGSGSAFHDSLRLVRPDGTVSWAQVASEPVRVGDVVTGHLATVTDVTGLRRAQHLAAAAQAQLAAAFSASPLGSAIVAPDGTVRQANDRLAELLETSPSALPGLPLEDVFEPDEVLDGPDWRRALLDGTLVSHRSERRLRTPGHAETWVLVSVAPIRAEQEHLGLLYQLEDITERRLAEGRVQHLALHDPLTDLPNRALLLDRLQQALSQAGRYGRGVGLLFIDLDRFKAVNDSFGHGAGDLVLSTVATRLRATARTTDTVARLGGDEFVVVLPDVGSHRDVLEVAEKMRLAVRAPVGIGNQSVTVDLSIGVTFGVGQDAAESLLQAADMAMYRAKDHGGGRLEVFDDDLRGRVQRRLEVELDLRHAVDRDEVETWYQPIVDVVAGQIVAHEALVRWRHPLHGLVHPGRFVSVAEETGCIAGIGEAVLVQACSAAALAPAGPSVSVNVSALQFVNADFGAIVDRALEVSGLPADRLWLELTESAVVQAIDSAARTFQSLRRRGVRLAIDDFGTGYSSFSHLRAFRVDLLKIDMEFIRGVTESDYDRAIVGGILRLADSLDLDVVAEGVESAEQSEALQRLGCRYLQGYLFAQATATPVASVRWPGPVPVRPVPGRPRRPAGLVPRVGPARLG